MQQIPFSNTLASFHTDKPVQKTDPVYGRKLAEQLLKGWTEQNGHFVRRNRTIKENRDFARGDQDMKMFLDMLNIDGKKSFITLDMNPPKLIRKFLSLPIATFMEYEEKATLRAIDEMSLKDREQRKKEAEFRMHMKAQLGQMQQESGMPMAGPNDYVPEDQDDLDLYFELEDRVFEEIQMEKVTMDTLADNGLDNFKRKILIDGRDAGFMAAYVYRDINGVKRFVRCRPENMLYSFSEEDDFNDCKMMGEMKKIRVADFREQYPDIPEQKILELVKKSSQDPIVNKLSWNESFIFSALRPYDDALIEVFCFGVITTEEKFWVESRDKLNKAVIDEKKARPVYTKADGSKSLKPIDKNKEVIAKRVKVVYMGLYAPGAKEMLKWDIQTDMIKPHYALHEVMLPWVVVMPDNIEMEPQALTDRVKSDIRGLTLARLKLQQLLAKMKPDGIAVDINGLSDIDLGLGEALTPLEIQQVSDQTGVIYYRSEDPEDGSKKGLPITAIENNNIVSKVQTVINSYNFYLQSLRDTLGTNELAEGQAPNPRMGKSVMNNAVSISNRATFFLYEGYIKLLDAIAKRLVCLEWYDITEGKRKDTYGLGPEIADKVFDVSVSMMPTTDELQKIHEECDKALTAGMIDFEQSFKVRRYAKISIKLAERWLSKYIQKMKKEAAAANQQNQEFTFQSQQAAAKQTHEGKKEIEQVTADAKIRVQKEMNKGEEIKFIHKLIELQATGVGTIPPAFQPLVDAYLQTLATNLQLTAGEQQLDGVGIQMQMQQVQQAMQQPQEGQEQPQ